MKIKINSLIILFIFFATISSAQRHNRHEMHKKIEAYKVAYLTEKLDLSPEEAQKFWPVYNDMQKKEDSLRKFEHKCTKISHESIEEMNDKELEDFVNQRILNAQMKFELRKEYHQKLKAILPIKKVAQLYLAERDFKKFLLQKLGGRGHGQGQGRGFGGGHGGGGPMHEDF